MTTWVTMVGIVVVGAILARWALKRALVQAAIEQQVGDRALAGLAPTISLAPAPGHRWSDPGKFQSLSEPLRALGFSAVGVQAVPEFAGVVIAFYVHLGQQVACAIYDHPQAGIWLNFYTHYRDGRRCTATTQAATGLDPMPGATLIHAPGSSSRALYERFLQERPAGDREPMTPANVLARFQEAYASEMAWRYERGISAKELSRQIGKGAVRFKFRLRSE